MIRSTFVVVSGLPGSGKSTLARQLAGLLELPLIDKDDILEELFVSEGAGDELRRQILSRKSDELFKRAAGAFDGAILATFWHLNGMRPDSGTPPYWLIDLPGHIVHVHCACPPDVAAERFLRRTRHSGHRDHTRAGTTVLDDLRRLAHLPLLDLGPRIDVDTTQQVDAALVAGRIRRALDGHYSRDFPGSGSSP